MILTAQNLTITTFCIQTKNKQTSIMSKNSSSFLDIDSKILEDNLTFQECKPAGLDEYKALLGIENGDNAPWKLVTPKPGFCVKTCDGNKQKVFINICTLDELPEPKDIDEDTLLELIEKQDGTEYRVPLSLQEPRDQLDKAGNPAVCYDVAINPKFLSKVESSRVFKMFLIQVTFDGLKDKYEVDLDIEDYVVLNRVKCMGTLTAHRIKNFLKPYRPPKKLVEDVSNVKLPIHKLDNAPKVNYRFSCVQQDGCDFLYGEIHLPTTVKVQDIFLEVGPDRVHMKNCKSPAKLDVNLPVKMDPTSFKSEFSTASRILHFVAVITSL